MTSIPRAWMLETSFAAAGDSAPERAMKARCFAPRSIIQNVKLRPRPPRQPMRRYTASGLKRLFVEAGLDEPFVSDLLSGMSRLVKILPSESRYSESDEPFAAICLSVSRIMVSVILSSELEWVSRSTVISDSERFSDRKHRHKPETKACSGRLAVRRPPAVTQSM